MRHFATFQAVLGLSLAAAAWVKADELAQQPSWSIPTTADVKACLDDYLAGRPLDEATRLKIEALWPDEAQPMDGSELLDRLTASLAVVEPKAAEVVAAVQRGGAVLVAPRFAGLSDPELPPLVRDNLRLLVGRWLAQHELIDEALEVLAGVSPAHVADPATLLFYQAMGQHRLLQKEACLATVQRLLQREVEIPRRYATLAKLMAADIQPLKPDTLDEIARLMADIRRRLALARAGKKVRDQEDEVIAKLEKMIDELEQQRQMRQPQARQSGSGRQPNQPMQDSNPAQLKGPGEVDPKSIGKKDGWGNLPPKQRQEVLQQIGRDLPAHFRETIEEYFKRLAQDNIR